MKLFNVDIQTSNTYSFMLMLSTKTAVQIITSIWYIQHTIEYLTLWGPQKFSMPNAN